MLTLERFYDSEKVEPAADIDRVKSTSTTSVTQLNTQAQ